jgi:hypothetical protein
VLEGERAGEPNGNVTGSVHCDAVLFDLDGVLVHDFAGIRASPGAVELLGALPDAETLGHRVGTNPSCRCSSAAPTRFVAVWSNWESAPSPVVRRPLVVCGWAGRDLPYAARKPIRGSSRPCAVSGAGQFCSCQAPWPYQAFGWTRQNTVFIDRKFRQARRRISVSRSSDASIDPRLHVDETRIGF